MRCVIQKLKKNEMMKNFKTENPTQTKAWNSLQQHFNQIKETHLQDLFANNPNREQELSVVDNDFYVDFSKNRWTTETLNLFTQLADQMGLRESIQQYMGANKLNFTEGRAVLHTALRSSKDEIVFEGENIMDAVNATKTKIKNFTDGIINGTQKGYTGKAFTDVVNIGIGGSDLGPKLICNALKYYKNHLNIHFASNVEGDATEEILKKINPETTLFIVVSKSFGTQETLKNSILIQNWFLQTAPKTAVPQHFVSVTSNVEKAVEFGIEKDNIFPMWDWVGGRFSLWSGVGMSVALSVGFENFNQILKGAEQADQHFLTADFDKNIPAQMAFLSVWYNNFFKAQSEAVIPYTEYLEHLVGYLQQAEMESNGKSVDRNGNRVNYETGGVVFGAVGTNAQHAFMQLLHQGTKIIPTDFIGYCTSLYGQKEHQDMLLANLFAQTNALAFGTRGEQVENAYKNFEGNKPSTTFLIKKLTPKSLGKLIAMYEHKIFAQGILWNINCYDQYGVELGKKLNAGILQKLQNNEADTALIQFYQNNK